MSFEPEWKGPVEGYVVNYLSRHHWKIARSCPREDAMQEAYCVFLRVKRKYPNLDAPQHFMALFKTAWANHFTDLANVDTEQRVEGPMPLDLEGHEIEQVGESDNDGMLALMIRQAPRDVMLVLTLMLNAPQELLDAALGNRGRDRRYKDGGSARINRLLGLPEGQDTIASVIAYFEQ